MLLKANRPRGGLQEGGMALLVVPQAVVLVVPQAVPVVDHIHLLYFLCIPGDHTLESKLYMQCEKESYDIG